jgi:tetratricopeptide (TPR) repeat protein
MRRALRKGVPPLFKELKYLFEDDDKLKIVESLVMSYAQNLSESGRFAKEDNGDKEYPTTLLWVYYYLAQHFDYKNQSDKALYYINLAIEHTPTLVELYMVKGKINKHIGNYYEAVRWMDEAQSLDTADRFINYKCSKYMLRANMIDEAQEIASKFTRVSYKGVRDLNFFFFTFHPLCSIFRKTLYLSNT